MAKKKILIALLVLCVLAVLLTACTDGPTGGSLRDPSGIATMIHEASKPY